MGGPLRNKLMIPETYVDAVLDLLPTAKQPAWCRLTGNSMAPLICHGDFLLAQPGNRNIHVGDVIIFKSSQRQCAHRAVSIKFSQGRKLFLTKGDNSYDFDPPVPSGHVLARVLQVKNANGILRLDSISWRFRNYLIAFYSYAEGRRRQRDTTFWRLLDRVLAQCHKITGLRHFHRSDFYRCMRIARPKAVPTAETNGEQANGK